MLQVLCTVVSDIFPEIFKGVVKLGDLSLLKISLIATCKGGQVGMLFDGIHWPLARLKYLL